MVLSVGIEPTLQLPQSCVLSIERRERTWTLPHRAYLIKGEADPRDDPLPIGHVDPL